MSNLSTLPAERYSFFHLFQSLRPILGIGRLDREISQLPDSVNNLLVPLQGVESVLVLLRLGVVQPV